jgi:hypothetical protein
MKQDKHQTIGFLLDLPDSFSVKDFENYLTAYLERKHDHELAIRELDRQIACVQNFILLLSICLKQKLIHDETKEMIKNCDQLLYTKQEIANRYRVSIRTVTNWIIAGLEALEIGGVRRISHQAIEAFVRTNRTKKPHWKSIARK